MNEFRSQIFGQRSAEPKPLLGAKRPRGAKADALESVKIARGESRSTDTRDADRHRLISQLVSITYKRKRIDVELVNLSGGGAMIAGNLSPNLWERIDLHLGEGPGIECAVRWVKGGRVGLEFAHETRVECSPRERAELLRQTIARSFPETAVNVAVPAAPEKKAAPAEDLPDEGDQRDNSRHPLIWSGQIHYDYESTEVRLRNISRTGALIECSIDLPVGAEPLLDLGEAGTIFATVTWSVGDKAGLKFKSDFDLGQLACRRPDLAPLQWDAPSYLRESAEPDSPWDENWRRLSIDELGEELDGFMKR